MKILVHILATALTLLVISQLSIGVTVSNFYIAIIVALIWGVVMLIIRPVLGLLTLPINILTLGLFSFVLNALLFWFIASFVQGFEVAGFISALLGSVILSAVSWVLHMAYRD